MTRSEAIELVKQNIKNKNLISHSLAVEAVMTGLASKLGQDVDKWALAGLLHDIDYEKTKDCPQDHSQIGAQMLQDLDVETEIVEAVRKHNKMHGLIHETEIEKALYCADPITGLIVTSALVQPSKKLADVKPESVIKKFNTKGLAAGADREAIKSCESLGITLEEFVELSLTYMQMHSDDLGL